MSTITTELSPGQSCVFLHKDTVHHGNVVMVNVCVTSLTGSITYKVKSSAFEDNIDIRECRIGKDRESLLSKL